MVKLELTEKEVIFLLDTLYSYTGKYDLSANRLIGWDIYDKLTHSKDVHELQKSVPLPEESI